MGDIPNYTNIKPSSRLVRPWASAGPLDVETSPVGTHGESPLPSVLGLFSLPILHR